MMLTTVKSHSAVVRKGIKTVLGCEDDVYKKRKLMTFSSTSTGTSHRIQPGANRPLGKREKTRMMSGTSRRKRETLGTYHAVELYARGVEKSPFERNPHSSRTPWRTRRSEVSRADQSSD